MRAALRLDFDDSWNNRAAARGLGKDPAERSPRHGAQMSAARAVNFLFGDKSLLSLGEIASEHERGAFTYESAREIKWEQMGILVRQ